MDNHFFFFFFTYKLFFLILSILALKRTSPSVNSSVKPRQLLRSTSLHLPAACAGDHPQSHLSPVLFVEDHGGLHQSGACGGCLPFMLIRTTQASSKGWMNNGSVRFRGFISHTSMHRAFVFSV